MKRSLIMTTLVLSSLLTTHLALADAVSRQIESIDWKSGDIIFHTSQSSQAGSIIWATQSDFSHVGLVEVSGGKRFVIEAISPVSRTPLEKWIRRGIDHQFAVFRYRGSFSPQQVQTLISSAKSYLGRPYDLYFSFHNEAIYCSELIYFAFKKIGLMAGRLEKVRDLRPEVDDPNSDDLVKALAKKRWKGHPLCKGLRNFDQCWPRILDDELVSPASISRDSKFYQVFSSYPR